MPIIKLKTRIAAPITRCFDLSRSIDLHKISTQHTNEVAIDGVMSGLIGWNEMVTWRARHFGVTQTLTTLITEFSHPTSFVDEMQKGVFKRFRHEHHFSEFDGITTMKDLFDYTSPLGIVGKLADYLFLEKYMTGLLIKRNQVLKEFAESDRWKEVLEF